MQTHVLPRFPQTAGNSLQNKSAEGQWVFQHVALNGRLGFHLMIYYIQSDGHVLTQEECVQGERGEGGGGEGVGGRGEVMDVVQRNVGNFISAAL